MDLPRPSPMNEEILPELIQAVEQQIASPQTPYVKKTYDRLVKLGLEETRAKEQIAVCLGEEMEHVMKTKRAFDAKAYKEALEELPFEEEEGEEENGGEEPA